ncbi:hypothetical protein GCM10020331_099850 [Ectobacillus funiculus]
MNSFSKRPTNEDLVFTHGDYCLPNIIINEGKVSGFYRLGGRAGISDRYQDLALVIRSIAYNFWRESHSPFFLKTYGVTGLDELKKIFLLSTHG